MSKKKRRLFVNDIVKLINAINLEYGFNIREAAQLRELVTKLNLTNLVYIYPGADEARVTLKYQPISL